VTPRISIVGGGSFGIGLAKSAARADTQVRLWSRKQPKLGKGVEITDSVEAVAQNELIVLAVPSLYAAELLEELGRFVDGRHLVAHVSRGLVPSETGQLRTLSQLVTAVTVVRRVGALAGPLVPDDLAQGNPTGGVVGTRFPELVEALRTALGGPNNRLRLYGSNDLLGVELASALAGALLFTIGYARAIGLGASAVAMLATRGLAEITRLGVAMGAKARTFSGLAGAGDVFAAVAGTRRPEVVLGERVAKGKGMDQALGNLGAHVESASIATNIAEYAERLGVEVPIAQTVAAMLAGELTGEDALERLMARKVGIE
jgi:glycerol-3-phosphate dehydrogenase (NAD(P)+)